MMGVRAYKTIAAATQCPMCGQRHDRITCVSGDRLPRNGNITLCLRCGHFLVFDDTRLEGLRPPTPQENQDIRNDRRCRRIEKAWRMSRMMMERR